MMNAETQIQIIEKIQDILGTKVLETKIPPQGYDSDVFLIKDDTNQEYAIKFCDGADNDVVALDLIEQYKLKIPVPRHFGNFIFEAKTVLILEKIKFPLLETVTQPEMYKYVLSMLENLAELHTIKSDVVGILTEKNKPENWKDKLLFEFSGSHPWYPLEEVEQRELVDAELLSESIEKLKKRINENKFLTANYSLMHTDFNQRNLFVNEKTHEIAGIIDWSEAQFGDPLYDFARVKLFITHFGLGEQGFKIFNDFLKLSGSDKRLIDTYFISIVIEYINWYSEERNEFNDGRIKLHQKILSEFDWDL